MGWRHDDRLTYVIPSSNLYCQIKRFDSVRTHDTAFAVRREFEIATATIPSKKADHKGRLFYLEGLVGFEPTTRGLRGHCSNQLSYRPVILAIRAILTI